MLEEHERQFYQTRKDCLVSELVEAWRKKGVIERYRWWGAIATISGVLNRHSFVRLAERTSLCVWICLVAYPSNGKSTIIKRVNWMWREAKHPQLLANNFTRAAFIDQMEQAQDYWKAIHGPKAYASCVCWAQDELGDQMAAYDQELTTFLTKSWGDDLELSEGRRSHGGKIIFRPGMSLIVGNQPAKMAQSFPATSWGQGFTDRMMFVFNPENTKRNPFVAYEGGSMGQSDKEIFGGFVKRLSLLSRSYYDISLSEEVQNYASAWAEKGYAPVPTHPKLEYYASRRAFHVTKLAGVFTVARCCVAIERPGKAIKLEMTLGDFKAALSMVLENETFLPEMFGASQDMTHEGQYVELAAWLGRKGGKASLVDVNAYLRGVLPAYAIERTLETALSSGLIVQVGIGPTALVKLVQKNG